MSNSPRYRVVDLPEGRRIWLNALAMPGPRHVMYGLLEVDVTAPRHFIDQHKQRTGETLSFTGYLTGCLGRAVAEAPSVQAYRKGNGQLVLFDDVHVGLMLERPEGDRRLLMGYVVERANSKSYAQIHQEIRAAQANPVPPGRGMPAWFRRGMSLPWPLSRVFIAGLDAARRLAPASYVSSTGTVGLTSVGMFGQGHAGWGLYAPAHSLEVIVGSIAWKPAVYDGRIEPRLILHLTLVFDHEVVDGAPAARFARRLVELVESGAGLAESFPATDGSAR